MPEHLDEFLIEQQAVEQLRSAHEGTLKSVRQTLEETLRDVKRDLGKLIDALNKNDKKEKS